MCHLAWPHTSRLLHGGHIQPRCPAGTLCLTSQLSTTWVPGLLLPSLFANGSPAFPDQSIHYKPALQNNTLGVRTPRARRPAAVDQDVWEPAPCPHAAAEPRPSPPAAAPHPWALGLESPPFCGSCCLRMGHSCSSEQGLPVASKGVCRLGAETSCPPNGHRTLFCPPTTAPAPAWAGPVLRLPPGTWSSASRGCPLVAQGGTAQKRPCPSSFKHASDGDF